VETQFVQVALSKRQPWNFYYWPTKADALHEPWAGGNGRVDTMRPVGDDIMVATPGGYIAPGQDIIRAGPNGLLETPAAAGDTITWFPNMYDDLTFRGADGTMFSTPSPMLKYDQLFSTNARNWEAANSQNQDIQRWPGHCLGGAVASIMLNEPVPAPGSGLKPDELKALWAELGENHYNHQIGDYANEIPPGPPRPGYDATDVHAPRFHNMLETHIRGNKQNLLGNLRAFPPRGTIGEVWNHGIGKYIATYSAVPGKGERSVRLKVELFANSGSNLNNEDNKPRVNTYEYIIVYGLDGKVRCSPATPAETPPPPPPAEASSGSSADAEFGLFLPLESGISDLRSLIQDRENPGLGLEIPASPSWIRNLGSEIRVSVARLLFQERVTRSRPGDLLLRDRVAGTPALPDPTPFPRPREAPDRTGFRVRNFRHGRSSFAVVLVD
jgi:hypothetical protein